MLERNRLTRAAAVFALALAVVACRAPGVEERAPVAGPAVAAPSTVTAGVAAANPMAVEAGLAVLRAGGSAVDAAVAVQAMLGLVEPQSSGLGGGAFLLHYDAQTRRITAFDGREIAPAGASPDMFLGADGKPLPFREAVLSGRSTGVPGALPMLGLAHERYGKLPWNQLFGAAIEKADQGFTVPNRLARFVNGQFPQAQLPDAKKLFARADGTPVQAGDLLRNPGYAATLRSVAASGPRTLLGDPIAGKIVERIQAPPLPGSLTRADLQAYQPRAGDAVCRPYRVYVVCVPPPPSSGVALLQMLAILERTDIGNRGPQDPQAWFLFAEASRIMYADRDRYIGDPAFVDVPVAGLLDPAYVATRAKLIGEKAGPVPVAGEPAGVKRGADATKEAAGTSHFVVVDAQGDVVSMTTSVESLFGSGRNVDGFFLNNQLTDFSFSPVEDGRPVANAVAPRKRPRSSMSPVIVLDRDGRLFAALGSPGGSAILVYNAKTLVGLLDWHLTLQEAINLPNIFARGDTFYGEVPRLSPEILAGLEARGVKVQSGRGEESGLHGVAVRADGSIEGAADPRREGQWRTVSP